MSGKRQHFIPRFLQKGFASHRDGKQVFTWVYRKGRNAFNSNIINVGVEGSFYTEEDDTQADDIITEAERAFGGLIEKLRVAKSGPTCDPQLPALIAHLEVRTRSLRQSFATSAGCLLQEFYKFLGDKEAFVNFCWRQFQNNPQMLEEMVAEECAKLGLPPNAHEQIMPMLRASLPAWFEHLKARLPEIGEGFRSQFAEGIPKAAKSGHLRALRKDVSPQPKVKRYTSLSYNILDLPNDSLILGDSPVVFEVAGMRRCKTLVEKGDTLKSVYLPLTPDRLLLGTYSTSGAPTADLPKLIARCSLEHFISHRRCEANSLLQTEIGQDAYLLSEKEIEDICAGILHE